MCFTIDKNFKNPIVIKNNLFVLKKGSDVSKGLLNPDKTRRTYFHSVTKDWSYPQFFFQTPIELKTKWKDISSTESITIINEGYHSYHSLTFREAEVNRIGIFVIPYKVNFYITENNSEVVSSNIYFYKPFSDVWKKIKGIKSGTEIQIEGTDEQLYISVEWEIDLQTYKRRKVITITNKKFPKFFEPREKERKIIERRNK